MASRFVVLGLAQARSQWFASVAQWANTGAVPIDFVKCVSVAEVVARLESGRAFSALLADGGLAGVDRDLIGVSQNAGCSVIVVDDSRVQRDWMSLGADAVLLPVFDRSDLLDALERHANAISRPAVLPGYVHSDDAVAPRARVATVLGPGGTGASTVSAALAQGIAVSPGTRVLLADFCRWADQAMLHDTRDVVPGIQEIVEAHRSGRPSVEDVQATTYFIEARGYSLLLGLRRAHEWASLRRRAFEASFETIRRAYDVVVCDCEADLEGEVDGGSVDVEDRNVMARTAATRADVVFAVGEPSMKGAHALVRVVADLVGFGLPPERVVPVVNRAPKHPRSRAEIGRSLKALLEPVGAERMIAPLFLPDRGVDDAFRDGTMLPQPIAQALAVAFHAAVSEPAALAARDTSPRKVVPGTLGAWAAAAAEDAR